MNLLEEELKVFILDQQEKWYRIAYSYVKDRECALDVVQEAILTSYEKISTLREPEYMKTWFYRILINEAISTIRKRKRLVFFGDSPTHKVNQMEHIDEEMMLYEAVISLKPKYRTVILLRFFEDMKISEIARVVQCPESTVKSRIKKGLDLLKEKMGDEKIYEREITVGSESLSSDRRTRPV